MKTEFKLIEKYVPIIVLNNSNYLQHLCTFNCLFIKILILYNVLFNVLYFCLFLFTKS